MTFLEANRDELIARCRRKAAHRKVPAMVADTMDHGVPQFLQQLIDTLRLADSAPSTAVLAREPAPAATAIGRSAALHGAALLRSGYNADQVVHCYGDVCQSVTELAMERHATIQTNEFRILNGALDNAIADAVTAFGKANRLSLQDHAQTLDARLGAMAAEQRKLADIAMQSFLAIKTGNIGLGGATGALLVHVLGELRALADRMQAEAEV